MSSNELHNLGLAHLRGGDPKECVRVYRRVVRRKRMVEAYANLGYCLGQLGPEHAEEALEMYETARQRDPDSPVVVLGRGLTLVRLGRTDGAEIARAWLLDRDPEAARVLAEAIETGHAPPADPPPGVFGPLPTPRRAPTGIMGD